MEHQPSHESEQGELRQALEQALSLANTIAQRVYDAEHDLGILTTHIENIRRSLDGEEAERVPMTTDETKDYMRHIGRQVRIALDAGESEESIRERFGIYGGAPLEWSAEGGDGTA